MADQDFNPDIEDEYDIQDALNSARTERDNQIQSSQSQPHPQSQPQFQVGAPPMQSTHPTQPRRPRVFYNPETDTQSVQTVPVSMAGYPMQNVQLVAVPKGSKLLQPDGESDDVDFELLTYEDIQINLRLLADIVQDEKLHVSSDGKHMVVDNRYGQTVRRYYSGDSRQKTLKFIKHVYKETERHCTEIVDLVNDNQQPKENTEKLVNLYSLIEASVRGLDRLNMTYSDDKLCAAKIATIKKNFQTYCDRTLKGTIDGFRQQHQIAD